LAASTGVVSRKVGLILRTSLTNILNDDEAGETDTLSIEEILVDAARVDAHTLLSEIIVSVTLLAFAADSVDGIEAGDAVTVFGGEIEYLVYSAAIAFGLEAVLYFDGRSAVHAVLGVGEDC
jgi:hypothetical protein